MCVFVKAGHTAWNFFYKEKSLSVGPSQLPLVDIIDDDDTSIVKRWTFPVDINDDCYTLSVKHWTFALAIG